MSELLDIRKTKTSLHSQSDGIVERFSSTMEINLRMLVNENRTDWDQHIPLFLQAQRTATHETTGLTPASIPFSKELRLPTDLLFGIPEDHPVTKNDNLRQRKDRLKSIHRAARSKINLKSNRIQMDFKKLTYGSTTRLGGKAGTPSYSVLGRARIKS